MAMGRSETAGLCDCAGGRIWRRVRLAASTWPGRRVALARIDDEFFAIDDTCSHADFSLSEGDVDMSTSAPWSAPPTAACSICAPATP